LCTGRTARKNCAALRYRCASENANVDTKNVNKTTSPVLTQAPGIIVTRTGNVPDRSQGPDHVPTHGHEVIEERGR